MLEPYVRPGIDDRPDLDKALSPEDKDAVARLAIKDRRRPPEASADQPEAQAVRLAAAGSSAAAAAAASVDAPAPDLSSAYLDMRDPMVAANGQRPTAVQISRLNWGFFVASILVGAPWAALNTIAMPNAVARLFDYDTASAISVTINPSTGRPLPVATDLVMPLAVLVVVGVVASMFAMPLVSALSDRTRIPLGRRTPWMVAGGVLCALITLVLGQNTGLVVLCFFWALMQFAYAMISVPLASAISERVPDKFRPRIERWHGIGVMLGQALGVCMGALGVMFDSFTPFAYTAVLFAVSGILTVIMLPKEPSSQEQPHQRFESSQVFDQLRPPAHAPAFARVFAARVCMMTGIGLIGVFLWYLVRLGVWQGCGVHFRAIDHSRGPPHRRHGRGNAHRCCARVLGRWADLREDRGTEHRHHCSGGGILPAVCHRRGGGMGARRLVHRHGTRKRHAALRADLRICLRRLRCVRP